jgi:hypothetical protein
MQAVDLLGAQVEHRQPFAAFGGGAARAERADINAAQVSITVTSHTSWPAHFQSRAWAEHLEIETVHHLLLSTHSHPCVVNTRGAAFASPSALRSNSAITWAPSNSSVAPSSRLSSTAIEVVSEP